MRSYVARLVDVENETAVARQVRSRRARTAAASSLLVRAVMRVTENKRTWVRAVLLCFEALPVLTSTRMHTRTRGDRNQSKG